jgi:hypothetical protein
LPSLFSLLVGLTIIQFNDLFASLQETLFSTSLDGEIKETKGRPRSLFSKDQLLLTLLWMRQYCSEKMLSWIFQISSSQIFRYTRNTLHILYISLQHHVHFPSNKQRLHRKIVWRKKWITVIIDGSEQQVVVSEHPLHEKSCYSGKKKKHTFTILLACDPYGKIIHVSFSYCGSQTDQQLLAKKENAFYDWVSWIETIVGDCGFKNLPKLCRHKCQWVLPFDEQYSEFLNAEDELFQSEVKTVRIVIENVIAQIKKWKICKLPFRGKTNSMPAALEEHHKVWVVCAALVNLYVGDLRE